MNCSKGYIYIRTHPSYDFYDACKLGKTDNIKNRESCYITSEIERGVFSYVFEVPLKKLYCAELWLHYEFKSYHIYFDGGTEFYKKTIIPLIIETLKKHAIEENKIVKLSEKFSKKAQIRNEELKGHFA